MSGVLNVTFARDMPAAAVEVIGPDMRLVERIMLAPGRSKSVLVPSEQSFLRVHLPSGDVVTLEDPSGSLSRTVSMEQVRGELWSGSDVDAEPAAPLAAYSPDESPQEDLQNFSRVASYHTKRAARAVRASNDFTELPLSSYGTAQLVYQDMPVPGTSVADGREAEWVCSFDAADPGQKAPLLKVRRTTGAVLTVRLPSDVQRCWTRADLLRDKGVLSYSVRFSTRESAADAILGYLQRGDLHSAEAMSEWVDEASNLLGDKAQDPYGAVVGGYLLLRLKKFEELRNWAKNLADRFPLLPDGCVIWAWQLMHQERSSRRSEIYDYFLQAAARGLPVYTEGLRLLLDGLRAIGSDGQKAMEDLVSKAGAVEWDSPVTATVMAPPDYTPSSESYTIVYDIALAAVA